jgi:GNAT superfamily N-acetyltransferase
MYPNQTYPELNLERLASKPRLEAETLVANQDGKAVGLAIVAFVDYGLYPYGVLEELVVDRQHRGGGVGQRLVEEAYRWVAARGASVLYADPVSGQAEDFYRTMGFEASSRPRLVRVIDAETEVAPGRWA